MAKALLVASPSSRRAWIEIYRPAHDSSTTWVALLAEGVDRNPRPKRQMTITLVALLAEGVDRNFEVGGLEYNADRRPPRGGRG